MSYKKSTEPMTGPWEILRGAHDSQGQILIISNHDTKPDEDAWRIASIVNACGMDEDTAEANARLISAAPELLRQLEFAADVLSGLGLAGSAQVQSMRATITKAKGGASNV